MCGNARKATSIVYPIQYATAEEAAKDPAAHVNLSYVLFLKVFFLLILYLFVAIQLRSTSSW